MTCTPSGCGTRAECFIPSFTSGSHLVVPVAGHFLLLQLLRGEEEQVREEQLELRVVFQTKTHQVSELCCQAAVRLLHVHNFGVGAQNVELP